MIHVAVSKKGVIKHLPEKSFSLNGVFGTLATRTPISTKNK